MKGGEHRIRDAPIGTMELYNASVKSAVLRGLHLNKLVGDAHVPVVVLNE